MGDYISVRVSPELKSRIELFIKKNNMRMSEFITASIIVMLEKESYKKEVINITNFVSLKYRSKGYSSKGKAFMYAMHLPINITKKIASMVQDNILLRNYHIPYDAIQFIITDSTEYYNSLPDIIKASIAIPMQPLLNLTNKKEIDNFIDNTLRITRGITIKEVPQVEFKRRKHDIKQ